ncbi:MAG: hypothetical protein HQK72_13545 [Desulfamplus sp.]|nr:hypothetical protein [Desulfamplus sp.]
MNIYLDLNIEGIAQNGVSRGDYCEAIAMQWINARWPHSQIIDTRVGPHGIDFAVLLPNTMDGKLLAIVEVKAAKARLAKAKGNTPAQMSEQWILERIRKHKTLRIEAKGCNYAFKEIIRVNPEKKKVSLMKHTGEKVDLSEFK